MLRFVFVVLAGTAAATGFWVERWTWRPAAEVLFLAVGQGDCTVIRYGNSAVLVDVGPANPYTDAGERVIAPELRRMGVTSVPLIVLTHPDQDHIGGLGAVVRAFPGARVAAADHFRRDGSLMAALRDARIDAAMVEWIGHESHATFGPFEIRFASPGPGGSTNDGSLFAKVRARGFSVTLSGDAGIPVEMAMAARGDWKADVMQLGHHGSRTSSGSAWLEAVRPTIAVASVGRDNRYGHPHASVVRSLEERGIKLLRTDRSGTITVRSTPTGYEVVTSR